MNQEEAKLQTDFADKLLAATNASGLVVSDEAELAGLSDADVAAAAEEAKTRGLAGKWVLALQNTTQQPALSSLTNRSVRERLLQASVNRTNRGDANDTKAFVTRLSEVRARKAKLLGDGSLSQQSGAGSGLHPNPSGAPFFAWRRIDRSKANRGRKEPLRVPDRLGSEPALRMCRTLNTALQRSRVPRFARVRSPVRRIR